MAGVSGIPSATRCACGTSHRGRTALPHEKLSTAAISQDGRSVASASVDGDAQIWDVASAKKRWELAGSEPRPGGLAFSPDSKQVVAWGNDYVLRNYDAESGRLVSEHRPRPSGFPKLKEDDDKSPEKRIARVEIFRNLQGKLKFNSALSADGSCLIWSFGKFCIFDASSGKHLGDFEGVADGNAFNSLRAKISADREWLLVEKRGIQGIPQPVTLYNLRLGRVLGELNFQFPSFSTDLAMSRDGLCFAVATDHPQAKIHIYETATLERRLTISQEHGAVTRLAFSPRSRFLAAAQTDGTVLVYDLRERP
jgi:WD40 repeat protein